MTPKKTPSKRVLGIVMEALEEVESGFYWTGFSASSDEEVEVEIQPTVQDTDTIAQEPEIGDEDEEAYGADDLSDHPDGFDREEIEVAIDAFLTALHEARVIKKNKKGNLPSFAGVFLLIWGEGHKVYKQALEFAEFVEGYFGFVSFENMANARVQFEQIKEFVAAELKKC